MPNGTPPAATHRRYDLFGGRGIVAQAKQRIAQVEPAGELEALLKPCSTPRSCSKRPML